jgi:hypothetical protein
VLILGMSEARGAGAAVVVDDRVVAWVAGSSRPELPWDAAESALAAAGARPGDVDVLAVAGAYTPMVLRKTSALQRLADAPRSPVRAAAALWQAFARQSGAGAFQADVAAEWLQGEATARGYAPRRVLTVEVQHALAAAAYRMQPLDEAVVVGLHPRGDGAALAVHLGRAGQLDRTFVQTGFEALHVHLDRVLEAMGLRLVDMGGLGALAARAPERGAEGDGSDELAQLLAAELSADGPGLTRRDWLKPGRPDDPVLAALRAVPAEVAARAVFDNLVEALGEVARWHLAEHGVDHLALVGHVATDARLASAIAARAGAARLTVPPSPGTASLALGAAAAEAGLAPAERTWRVSPPPDVATIEAASRRAGVADVPREGWLPRLMRGESVVRWREAAGPDKIGLGERCVVVRADDPVALEQARGALRRPATEVPRVLALADAPWLDPDPVGGACLAWGTASASLPPELAHLAGADGRGVVLVAPPGSSLDRMIRAAQRQGAAGAALAAIPLAEGEGDVVGSLEAALDLWRRAQLGAFLAPDRVLERAG